MQYWKKTLATDELDDELKRKQNIMLKNKILPADIHSHEFWAAFPIRE